MVLVIAPAPVVAVAGAVVVVAPAMLVEALIAMLAAASAVVVDTVVVLIVVPVDASRTRVSCGSRVSRVPLSATCAHHASPRVHVSGHCGMADDMA